MGNRPKHPRKPVASIAAAPQSPRPAQEVEYTGVVDDFSELFGDGTEDVSVELYRLSPEFAGGVRVKGFLERLSPGSDLSYVKSTYGGGSYRLIRRLGHTFKDNKLFDIAGVPLVPKDTAPAVPTAQAASAVPTVSSDTVTTIEGIAVGVEDQQFIRQLRQVLLLKSVLKEPPSPDMRLITDLVGKLTTTASNPLQMLGQVKDAIAAVRDLIPEQVETVAGGGDGDLLSTIVKFLPAIASLSNRSAVAGDPVRPSLPAPSVPQLPSKTDGEPIEESKSMDKQAIVNMAVGQLIAGFNLTPPKSPERMADLFKALLPPIPIVKAGITEARQLIFDMAELQLVDVFADHSERREEFQAYFEKILELYLS